MITALAAFAFAAAFLAIGRWGRAHAPELVPVHLSKDSRAAKERSLRRGARSVTLIGSLFALLGVLVAVGAVIGTTR